MAEMDQRTTGKEPLDRPGASDLARAAEDLEAITAAYDECSGALEAAEATVDALLDDPVARSLVLDGEGCIVAMSRGMAATIGRRDAVLDRPVREVAPADWPDLGAAAKGLTVDEGWRSLSLADGSGRLHLRRVSDAEQTAAIVVRHEPGG